MTKRTLDPMELERQQKEREQLVEVARFHRHVEAAALTAFREMLSGLVAEKYDLRFVEPEKMEELAKRAWEWGLVFAESRK